MDNVGNLAARSRKRESKNRTKSRSWFSPGAVEPDGAKNKEQKSACWGWWVELMRPKHAKIRKR
jgi:hypothetical protein